MSNQLPFSMIFFLFFLSPLFNSLTLAQLNLTLPNFSISLAAGSAVLESLRPAIDPSFDFSPSDVFHLRDGPGQYHTGDLTFRYRDAGSGGAWLTADTAAQRLNASTSAKGGMVTSNLNQALPNVTGLKITRTWRQVDGDLALSFTLSNIGEQTFEVGGLGMPIEMNNIFTGRTATETTAKCVLVDPYMGLNAGYAQVTRLTGKGPNLVISPLNSDSKFEAWRFLTEPENVPLGYQIQTFEGNYAWEVYTKAWAEIEWKGAEPWNTPTSISLEAGQDVTVGLRFSVAPGVQDIGDTVSSVGLPAAVGIPGYVLPYDLKGQLFLNTTRKIASMASFPAGALQITPHSQFYGEGESWQGFDITASSSAFGRARLDVTYADNTTQTIHYWITCSSPEAISKLGGFLTNEQWFTNTSDPFGRAPGVITYDRQNETYVDQDNRTWIAGQSDEGGAGAFLAAGMKQAFYPESAEVSKLEEMVHDVVWGTLQINGGNETYAVRKSLFYYQPDLMPGYHYDPYFNWTINPGETWDKAASYLIDRTYDYVHVSALYWGLYRSSLTYSSILKKHAPEWYLLQAYHTVVYACSNTTDGIPKTDYWNVGLMGERVWGYFLSDLYATNHTSQADHMSSLMKVRQQVWAGEPDPFGSEMG